MEHSRLPWRVYVDADAPGIYMTNMDSSCGPQIAKVLTENIDAENEFLAGIALADGQFIVTAVNCHDELLSLLKSMLRNFPAPPLPQRAAAVGGGRCRASARQKRDGQ